jgi:hypothetical protein
MNLEIETLKLRLIESQMMVLQYQHKEISENIKKLRDQQMESDKE